MAIQFNLIILFSNDCVRVIGHRCMFDHKLECVFDLGELRVQTPSLRKAVLHSYRFEVHTSKKERSRRR